eukprot:5466911-Pyramimonas_sp.AAC.1
MGTEYGTRESLDKDLDVQVDEHIRKAMTIMRDGVRPQAHQPPPQDQRELQVIVGGLKEEEEEDNHIIQQIQKVVKEHGMQD